nr:hypothetical protein [Tanacetum cinerariifolium]
MREKDYASWDKDTAHGEVGERVWKGSGGLQVYGSSCGRRVNSTRILAGVLVRVLC